MLLVRTKLAPSPIEGIGVFADEFIPKGTPVWEMILPFDSTFTATELDSLPSVAREQMLKHSYRDARLGVYVLCGDNARFFNHSPRPNVASKEDINRALRDIQPGEEITCDYREFDADFDAKLMTENRE